MQIRPRTTAGLVVLATLGLAACGGSEGEESSSSAAAGGGGETQQVVVYTNGASDGRGDWLTTEAAEAGFEVQIVELGGTDLMNRLIQEKNNPLADVYYGLNNIASIKAKEAGVLQAYTPAWSDQVESIDDDGTYWTIVREPIMQVCSDEAYPDGAGAPTDVPDLWENEEFHGSYEVPANLGGGTAQMTVTGILVRHLDESGELGVSDEGWAAIEDYFANGTPWMEGNDLFARMASGELTCGPMWLAGKIAREEEYGITTTALNPPVGVPMVNQTIGVVADGPNTEGAQAFVDWFGSAEVQGRWSTEFGTVPTNTEADSDPVATEITDSFTVQEIDWELVAANLDQWVEKIELDYLGQ